MSSSVVRIVSPASLADCVALLSVVRSGGEDDGGDGWGQAGGAVLAQGPAVHGHHGSRLEGGVMGEPDDGPVVVRAQQSERVTNRESLGLQRVVDEDFAIGCGDRPPVGHRRTELSVQIDSEGEDVLTQRLAVLVLDVWRLGNSGRAHQGRGCGSVVLGQVRGRFQLLVAQT